MSGLDLLGAAPINKPVIRPVPALKSASAAGPSTPVPAKTASKPAVPVPAPAAAAGPSGAKLQAAQGALAIARSLPKRMAKQAAGLTSRAQRALIKTAHRAMGSSLLGWSMGAAQAQAPAPGANDNDPTFLAALNAITDASHMATQVCIVLDALSGSGSITDAASALRKVTRASMGALIGYAVSDVISEGNGLLSRLSAAVDAYDPSAPDPSIPGMVSAISPDVSSWMQRVYALATATGTTAPGATPGAPGTTPAGAPTITSVTGASGMANTGGPGEQTNIVGTNFTGATGVSFGGIPTQFTVANPTTINAIVPMNAVAGTVSVVTPVGTATSAAPFNVIASSTAPGGGAGGGAYGGGGGGGGGSSGGGGYDDGGGQYADDGGDAGGDPYAQQDGGGYQDDGSGGGGGYAPQPTRADYFLSQLPYGGGQAYDDFQQGYESAPEDIAEGAADDQSYDGDDGSDDEYGDENVGGLSLLGAVTIGAVDVDGLIQRFTEIAHTNDMARNIWVDKGRGIQARVVKDAQDLLAKAIMPTNEFAWHDQVMAFAARGNALGDKLNTLALDDSECPYWGELESYLIDGSRLANSLEGAIDGSVKWTDVKEAAASAASGLKSAAASAESTIKWTTGLLVGGVVLLGGGIIYGLYKVLSGPTAQTVVGVAARRYLP